MRFPRQRHHRCFPRCCNRLRAAPPSDSMRSDCDNVAVKARQSFLRHFFSALFCLELLDQGLHFLVPTEYDIGQYTEDTAEE